MTRKTSALQSPADGETPWEFFRIRDDKGEYRFRTIKPVAYPGRPAPHIHVKVKRGDKFRCEAVTRNGDRAQVLVTQRDDDGTISWRVVPSR